MLRVSTAIGAHPRGSVLATVDMMTSTFKLVFAGQKTPVSRGTPRLPADKLRENHFPPRNDRHLPFSCLNMRWESGRYLCNSGACFALLNRAWTESVMPTQVELHSA
jgi:hypothetical protein